MRSVKTIASVTHSIAEAILLFRSGMLWRQGLGDRRGHGHRFPRPRTLAVRETPEFSAYNAPRAPGFSNPDGVFQHEPLAPQAG